MYYTLSITHIHIWIVLNCDDIWWVLEIWYIFVKVNSFWAKRIKELDFEDPLIPFGEPFSTFVKMFWKTHFFWRNFSKFKSRWLRRYYWIVISEAISSYVGMQSRLFYIVHFASGYLNLVYVICVCSVQM